MVNQKIALVVDDDPEIVASIKDFLRDELSYLVLAAVNPETAVEFAKNYAFDLIVLDLHMPKLDGFQVLEMVREKQPHVKVIVITGLYEEYRVRFEAARVDKVFEKPVNPLVFQQSVLEIAGRVDLEPQSGAVPRAKILIVDDESELCDTLKDFILDDKPNQYEVEIAQDGAAGIRLNTEMEPDVIFFDIKMPHMTGPEMMETIKKSAGHKPRFSIAISADGYQSLVEEIQSRGHVVFTKPFRIEKVLEHLREQCIKNSLTA